MMLDLNNLPGEPEQLERNANRKFTAREDDGTGLYYYQARYYHSALGRFATEDPLDMIDGPNTYAYVNDDPVEGVDPFGLTNQIGDFGWPYYWHPPSDWEAPSLNFYHVSREHLAEVMSQTCQRLDHPPTEDLAMLEMYGPNGFQKVFDNEFSLHGHRFYNVDGKLYRGNQIGYFGQGMYDEAWGNVPLLRVYGHKWREYTLWPDKETLEWYDEGRRQYKTKCRCP
jgi:RHS repeat-associated protein